MCVVAKLYLKRVRGFAQRTSASHQEQLAHMKGGYHRHHTLRPTCYLQGGQGAGGPCACRVVLRLAGGVPRGAWVPGRPAIDRAVVRAEGPPGGGRCRSGIKWAGAGHCLCGAR